MSSEQNYAYDPPKYDPQPVSQHQPVPYHQPVYQNQPVPHHQQVPHQHQFNAGYNQRGDGSTQVTVNVMTQQPQQQEMRSWSTSICGCFEDMASCCCVMWFCPCYACCSMSPRLGESCCAPICLTMFGHSVPMVYRTKVRAAHGIMGGAIDDCTNTLFCMPCVMCQMKRELDYIERATGKPAFR